MNPLQQPTSAAVIVERMDHWCVPQLVAAQAASHPEAIALAFGTEVLTFAELDRRSNQLAHYLKSLGVGRDQPVGLCLDRSPSMVLAALAILKAGGAYVPLDSSFPPERLGFMLRDAQVRVVVTRNSIAKQLPAGHWGIVDLAKDAGAVAACSSHPPESQVTAQNLAYVIYTSGSTGQPKGVEITHGGLANLVSWHCRAFHVTPEDRASHQAALGFDAAVWEIWPYLAAGATVYIPDESLRNDPEALRDWLVTERISITFLPSPLAERMLLLGWPRQTALRVLLTGADTLYRRPDPKLPFTLVNNYGPTECTVVATSGPVAPGETTARPPSIGRPIDNTEVYILDDEMREVPSGTTGQLYIGGPGLARGYHNRPELTSQVFVRNPFSSQPGDRLYRTGDLARYLSNGEIEFLGRVDEQVKIRGFRVEPNEIVRTLDEHSGVAASTVVARENQSGEKWLLAYVVLARESTVTAAELREHLRKQLPDYMVPVTFVRMESLPLTVNGKVDRKELPAPNATNTLRDEEFVSPSSLVEQRLATIIASLLRVDRVGANDNFFLLGGHSLLGTQLIAKVNQAFGVELTLLQLFDHPNLADMSAQIEELIFATLEATSTEVSDNGARHKANRTPASAD